MATLPSAPAPDPDGSEWRKQRNERRRQRNKEDKPPRVRDGNSRTPWTLIRAVELCAMCVFRSQNGAVPYPADSEEQIALWADFEQRRIPPNRRTLLMNTAGHPPGTKEHSPTIHNMLTSGKTVDVARKRKREGYEAVSRKLMGHDQKNAVEGVAIHLFLCFLRSVITDFDIEWEVMPVFDGLEADFMMRKKDWLLDLWVPLQMKSVSECVLGKQANYHLKRGDYPNVFCMCLGLLAYVHRASDVTGPNDITNAHGCSIGEIWNIGSCSNIETSLQPHFGVHYSKLSEDHRLHFPGATDEAKRGFTEALLRDIEAWPRMERNRILYEFSPHINLNVTAAYQIEKTGFEVVDKALRTCGLYVDPVWRQNECVDYAVASDSGTPVVFVSGKTGSVVNGKLKWRNFELGKAPNKRFCDLVVACYSGAYHKVAVIRCDKAYVEGKKHFYWNEDRLDPGVRVFDDIRTPEVARAFADHIRSFGTT